MPKFEAYKANKPLARQKKIPALKGLEHIPNRQFGASG
jgi:hypothetical protein